MEKTTTRLAEKLLEQALALSTEERGMLASRLIESLDDEVDEDAEAAWAEEIRRRVEEIDLGLVKTVAWEEVRRQMLEEGGNEPSRR
jgi:putative addiction module component (TIGR02574 family)